MRVLKLRDSIFVRLRDSDKLFTQNCLANLSSFLDDLLIQNQLLENVLLASRRSIAQQVHLFSHVVREMHEFIHQERVHLLREDAPCDPNSVRTRFLSFIDRVQSYVDTYCATFHRSYRAMVSHASHFDYHSFTNRAFAQALPTCSTFRDLNRLVESHGGQVDYLDDFLPVLVKFHDTFSFTRNLLRDTTSSRALDGQLTLFVPSLINFLRYYSRRSILPESDAPTSGFSFLGECSKLIRRLETMSYDETLEFFQSLSPSSVDPSA